MELIATGKVTNRCDVKSGVSKNSGKEWKSVDYVITEDSQYPKRLAFTVFGEERVNKALAELHAQDVVTVHCNVDASEYQGRFFNSIQAWKIMKNGVDIFTGNSVQPPVQQATHAEIAPSESAPQSTLKDKAKSQQEENTEDDLPF